ncbi:hypothetical protein HPB51_015015 [Rhipicephalus microplus]|uniref:LIM zinc-binding domain-containing protein n=1 Tax=Rhipicephalus microplus TaxID=6941 RepID=A0A9J6EHR4_RHIMP|nr:hypothetical protein HPB51_015015 [Rhipicephalus microplus]
MPVISPGSDEAAAQALAPPKLCAGCGAPIADRFYLLAVERQWHTRCLRCCHCKQQLDSELTCFARDGNIYCKDDYYRKVHGIGDLEWRLEKCALATLVYTPSPPDRARAKEACEQAPKKGCQKGAMGIRLGSRNGSDHAKHNYTVPL